MNHPGKRFINIDVKIWLKITKIDELKGMWISGMTLSPQTLGRLKKSTLITSTGASTRIEGAHLSDEEIKKMLNGLSLQKWTERDKQEIKGYYEMLNHIFDQWKYLRLTENNIKHFHNELLKYVEKDQKHRGSYKKLENNVVAMDSFGKVIGIVFETTPPYLVEKQMQELILWTNDSFEKKELHPLLIIGNFVVEFLKIHPFQDGNGRLSRLLTNLLLLQQGYTYTPYVSHEKIIEENKTDYYLSLRKSQKTLGKKKEDIHPWLDFFLSVLLVQSKVANNLASEKQPEALLSENYLTVLNAIIKKGETFRSEIIKETGIIQPTVNKALQRLLELKLIKKIGLGRATRYSGNNADQAYFPPEPEGGKDY